MTLAKKRKSQNFCLSHIPLILSFIAPIFTANLSAQMNFHRASHKRYRFIMANIFASGTRYPRRCVDKFSSESRFPPVKTEGFLMQTREAITRWSEVASIPSFSKGVNLKGGSLSASPHIEGLGRGGQISSLPEGEYPIG